MTVQLAYLTGTRADFGLMVPILTAIAAEPGFALDLIVTGMHLSPQFGTTIDEVRSTGLTIATTILTAIDDDSGAAMAASAAAVLEGTARELAARARDALIVLGDRWEMLAAAQAGLYSGIPVIHLCGGERSGSIDDSIRHAISKLAHLHLVAAAEGEKRLLAMGEEAWRIHRIGAPGLAGLIALANVGRATLGARYGFDPARSYALLLFHPVVQDARLAGDQFDAVVAAMAGRDLQVLCLLPNADTGSAAVRARALAAGDAGRLVAIEHMPRADYVSVLRQAQVLVGNSSSGIVEAATLATPVVDVGDRQRDRLRGANVFYAEAIAPSIAAALDAALRFDPAGLVNVYGEARADRRVVEVLKAVDLAAPALLKKTMTY